MSRYLTWSAASHRPKPSDHREEQRHEQRQQHHLDRRHTP